MLRSILPLWCLCTATITWAEESALIVPAGTLLQIRIEQTLSSYTSKRDTAISAELIAPVMVGGKTLLPLRTELTGRIRDVHRVGLGISRENEMLHLEFDRIQVPGQAAQALSGMVTRLDDARERVDKKGRIRGIRATDTFSSKLMGVATSVAAVDPMALIFSLSASLSVFQFPDSSVVLPAGAELHFRLTEELVVAKESPNSYAPLFPSGTKPAALNSLIEQLPYRTTTKTDGTPSDVTSLMYLGSQAAIERAFGAAGWLRSDELNGTSKYGVMKSIVENQGYRAAPMSVLLLNEKEPELAYAKTLNTFFTRHHLRIYSQPQTLEGLPVWSSTATYDSGIGFSKATNTFIHLINENIDEEREKVLNDLHLTGCVDGVDFVERPWVPRDAKNSTGDTLRTDGRIAVIRLNECTKPLRADAEDVRSENLQLRQPAFLRPISATFLTLRNDLARGNVVYRAYQGIRLGIHFMKKKPAGPDAPKRFSYGGQEFLIVDGSRPVKSPGLPADAGAKPKMQAKERGPRSYSNRLSFSISGGLSGYGNSAFSTQPFTLSVTPVGGATVRDRLLFDSLFERGWTISPRLTLNTRKYVSHELSYSRTTTNFRLTAKDEIAGVNFDSRSKASIRTFAYNTLVHFTPNGSRIRPYVAIGPAIQLIHLLESKPEQYSVIRFAARDVAPIISAYNFSSKPALEGGGVFQFGLNYGAGMRMQLTPRVFLRADFRETISAQPDLWKNLPQKLVTNTNTPTQTLEFSPLVKYGALRHQSVTMGIGISF